MKILLIGFFLFLPASGGFAADITPYITASQWPTYDERRRANLARAAVRVVSPAADDYQMARHGFDVLRCMDLAFEGPARKYAARKNLFMMLKACAMQTK